MTKATMSSATKRQLAYSIVSLLATPFLLISITSANPIEFITENGELPFDILLFIGLGEFLKVCWVLWLFPRPNLTDRADVTSTVDEEAKQKSRLQLPLSKKDTVIGHPPHPRTVSRNKVVFLEAFWTIAGFICSVILGHVILVLFGAPFVQDWKLTLQLSFILVCWLFFPLCLVLRPDLILPELFYISIWDYDEFGLLFVAKWRFLLTCLGAWIGAIVVPLDWDRPWQKWPIPCLASAALSQLLINVCMCIYFLSKPSLNKTKAL